jgi:hypothetical protein
VIRAADEEAHECIERLGQVMQLRGSGQGREMLVAVCGLASGQLDAVSNEGPLPCSLPRRLNRQLGVIQMQEVVGRIAQSVLKQGGLLIHGALAEHYGCGFIMAGQSGIGKSTASRRLPEPWHSLSDDQTLVVRDSSGHYWAHPWPTWSRFCDDGPGGSWPTRAVPLNAILFLARAALDRVEPMTATNSTALLIAASPAPNPMVEWSLAGGARRTDLELRIQAARALAAVIPAFTLHISATGEFWHAIEQVLPSAEAGAPSRNAVVDTKMNGQPTETESPNERLADSPTRFRSVGPVAEGGRLRAVCVGPAMNPTLREPDILEVEPYGSKPVLPGDVVCFKSQFAEIPDARRVDGLTQAGIHTRGDGEGALNPWILNRADLVGRVVVAQRGSRRRTIAGGRRGRVIAMRVRFTRAVWSAIREVPRRIYGALARQGPFDRLLPLSLRPRLVRFEARPYLFMRLLVGRTTIGWFDPLREAWHIRRPFHLFVDEQTLGQAGSLASRDAERLRAATFGGAQEQRPA